MAVAVPAVESMAWTALKFDIHSVAYRWKL